MERAVVAANKEIWRLGDQLNFAVVYINGEVRTEEYRGALERDGIHFSCKMGANKEWHLGAVGKEIE